MGKQRKEIIKAALEKEYNVKKVYDWAGYADESREKPLVDIIELVSKELGFMPSYFYTIAIGEGLGHTYMDLDFNYETDYKNKTGEKILTNLPIDGFNTLGVDNFSSDFPEVKKYLPKDYNEGDEFKTVKVARNEWGGKTTVNSAVFNGLKNALYGFGAILCQRRDQFNTDRKKLKYGIPTEDQSAFWTYVYFQGQGTGIKYLTANGSLDFKKNPPTKVARINGGNGVRYKALERLATWRYMITKGIFTK